MSDRLAAAIAELTEALRAELAADTAVPVPDRLLSVTETAEMLGIGRSATYQAITAGRLHSIRIGRRRLVPISVASPHSFARRTARRDAHHGEEATDSELRALRSANRRVEPPLSRLTAAPST